MIEVTIPAALWEEDLEGAISVWFFEDGDGVAEGDTLCEIMVEKSTFEIASPASGRLSIVVDAEVPARRGDLIARIG